MFFFFSLLREECGKLLAPIRIREGEMLFLQKRLASNLWDGATVEDPRRPAKSLVPPELERERPPCRLGSYRAGPARERKNTAACWGRAKNSL